MSIRVMTFIWDSPCDSHTQKLVLLALADNANEQGFCWPSIKTIARRCQLSERSVFDQIRLLQVSKRLTVESGGGNTSNRYWINLDPCIPCTPERRAGVNAVQGTPEPLAPLPLQGLQGTPERRAGEPSYNRQGTAIEPKKEVAAAPELIVPTELNRLEFMAEWEKWIKFRKSKGGIKDWAALFQAQLERLSVLTIEQAIECLISSRTNGYTGIFPDKFHNRNNPKPDHRKERAAKECPQTIIPKILCPTPKSPTTTSPLNSSKPNGA